MSTDRIAIVKKAWQKLSNGAPAIPVETLFANYNAPAHPRVTSREKKAETVMSDFSMLMAEKCCDMQITEEGFMSYYADTNAVTPVDKDNYFIQILLKTWNMEGTRVTINAARLAELEDIIFEKIRQRTHGADDEGKTVRKIFKHFDLDGFGTICFSEFCRALESMGCAFPDFESRAIFDKYDKDGN